MKPSQAEKVAAAVSDLIEAKYYALDEQATVKDAWMATDAQAALRAALTDETV